MFVDVGSDGKALSRPLHWVKEFKKMLCTFLQKKPLDDTWDPSLPYVFGDEVFGLSTNLLRPYGGKYLSKKENNPQLSPMSSKAICLVHIRYTIL